MVTGAIAPASVKGVRTTTWLRLAIWKMPSHIGSSSRSGDEELMMVKSEGSRSSAASSIPRAILTISKASRLRWRPRL